MDSRIDLFCGEVFFETLGEAECVVINDLVTWGCIKVVVLVFEIGAIKAMFKIFYLTSNFFLPVEKII